MTRSTPHIPGSVWVLAGVAFAVALGFGVVAPAIPLFAREYGVGKTAIGMAISAFAFFRFVSALGAGGLVDKLGERRVLVVGLLTVALTTGTAPLAPHYALFVALRGVGGIGSAAFTVAATTLVLRLAPPEARGRAMNRYQSGFLFGGMMGPAIGGPLTDLDPRMPFFFYGVTLVVAAAVALIGLRRADNRRRQEALAATEPAPVIGWGQLVGMFRVNAYLAALVVSFGTGWMLFGVRNSLVPVYVVEELGRSATFVGIAMMVGALTQAIGITRAGWYADVAGRRPAIILGSVLAVAAVTVLVLPGNVVAFLISMGMLGFASSLLGSAPASVVGDLSPARGGRVVAAFQMSSDIGAVTGPLAAGALADAVGYQGAFAACVVVLSLGLIAAVRMPETGTPVRSWRGSLLSSSTPADGARPPT